MHRKVKEAAVIAREDVPGDRRLVAYVTAKESVELNASPEELRKHLKALLPDYMVPSAYVTLERMPRTQNEKLDRRAFPAPEQDAYVRRDYEPPAPGLEESLAEIWQPLLRVARVSRHENFFGLGGDSILAMQATVRMRSLLGIDIPVSAVFRAPTLEQLAKYLRSNRQLLQAGSTASANEDRPEDLLGRIASMPDQEVLDLLQRFSMRGTS
jgi:aryl carrier-like protein